MDADSSFHEVTYQNGLNLSKRLGILHNNNNNNNNNNKNNINNNNNNNNNNKNNKIISKLFLGMNYFEVSSFQETATLTVFVDIGIIKL